MDNIRLRIGWREVAVLAIGGLLGIPNGDRVTASETGPDAHARAIITWNAVGAPLGRILLIRRGQSVCAIRFSDAHRGRDTRPSTLFDSGDESFAAEYDWWYQEDSAVGLPLNAGEAGHGKVERKPLRGIGRLAFQAGETNVKCGPFSLPWTYPTLVRLYAGDRKGDQGIVMAPTNWSDVDQVDLHDPRVQWYRYDENRDTIYIPLVLLPPTSGK